MIKFLGFVAVLSASIFSLVVVAADSGAGSSDKEQFEKLLDTYQERLAAKNVDGILEIHRYIFTASAPPPEAK